MKKRIVSTDIDQQLFNDIKNLIEEGKSFVAAAVNSSMTMLFWKIGERINKDILDS